jgi:DNA-binding Lrp family transcriptional regulator
VSLRVIRSIRPNSPSSPMLSPTAPLPVNRSSDYTVRWRSDGSRREVAMVQAYILVQTEVGRAADVARTIAKIKGVTNADDVTGPYDVIVKAEAANMDNLGKLVVAQIQTVTGITRTLTCPIVNI